jgi:hypothetical protein
LYYVKCKFRDIIILTGLCLCAFHYNNKIIIVIISSSIVVLFSNIEIK